MMARYKFCLWLVERLSLKRMTFQEIADEWSRAAANIDGFALTARSFQRYRNIAEELFNVNIECHKPTNEYWVDTEPMEDAARWTMSALRVHSLASMVDMREYIMVEEPPAGSCLLKPLADACRQSLLVTVDYKSPYKPLLRYTLVPYFLRLYKQRWYVTGRQPGKDYLTTLALERMTLVGVAQSANPGPRVSPAEYYEGYYGVIRNGEPEPIVVRAFWPQDTYLKEVPLHASQRVVDETDEWTDFSLCVSPTYDFKQDMLWHRDKLTVLSPQWLRDDMADILRRMQYSYLTGLPDCKDE